ncbi:MAG TPA: helix-turn-helix domain-containing protein [Jatrophihabitans sp.]|nr:helix-turn-helix domain-containing protein [Jatrophihabitans sp.]
MAADPLQDLVDELAATLGLSVLIDDERLRALCWSAQSTVDPVRLHSILDHTVDPAAQAAVVDLGLSAASGVVRTPELAAVGMQPRWCAPIRTGRTLLGYLWVLDPGGVATPAHQAEIAAAARYAGRLLVAAGEPGDDRRKRELLAVLEQRPDGDAARALIILDRLDDEVHVVADLARERGAWPVRGAIFVQPVPAGHEPGTSGDPLPLLELHEAVRRARLTRRAIAAGAVLSAPRWDCLNSWRLVVEAPPTVVPADIHPGVAGLLDLGRPELVATARTLLDLGGDVRAAASALHLHRTTLYYRLERISTLTGVDLRDESQRHDLDLALRLAAFRSQPTV